MLHDSKTMSTVVMELFLHNLSTWECLEISRTGKSFYLGIYQMGERLALMQTHITRTDDWQVKPDSN